jgi:hypothetical protein
MSIATCNKLFENMMPFYGDKAKPRITGCTGGKTFSWVLDTGSAVTYMNKNAFEMALGITLEDGDTYKIDLFIKRRKCVHTITVKDKFSENIIGLDFIQKHRLHYDDEKKQLNFLNTPSKASFSVKKTSIPALS